MDAGQRVAGKLAPAIGIKASNSAVLRAQVGGNPGCGVEDERAFREFTSGSFEFDNEIGMAIGASGASAAAGSIGMTAGAGGAGIGATAGRFH